MHSELYNLATVEYGKSPNDVRDDEGVVPVYGTGGLIGYAREKLFDRDGVVIARKGTLDNPTFVSGNYWVIDTAYAALPKDNVDSKWLYYCLENYDLTKLNEATGVPSISRDYLYRIKFYTPEFLQQQKIAKILTTVDNLIEKTQALIDKYTAIKQGMMADLFTRGIDLSGTPETNSTYAQLRPAVEQAPDLYKQTELGWIPKEWEVRKLEEITLKIIDGTHHTPTYTEDGVPFLRVTDIQEEEIDKENIKFISEPEHIELTKRCNPEQGDILYSKNGTIGIPKIVDWDWEFSVFVSLCLIKPNHSSINNIFLEYFLDSELVWWQIRLRSKQGTVTNLHLEEIREFLIPLPPKEEQLSIVERLNAISFLLSNENRYLAKLKNQKKGLMQDLLTGKVQVN